MLALHAKWNERDVGRWRGDPIEQALVKALKNAGDRAGRRMLTDAVKFVTSKKRLKQGWVRAQLQLIRPGKSAKIDDLIWVVKVSGKTIPLRMYPVTKQTASGVTARVNVGKAQKIAHAFLATMPDGHEGIFLRRSKKRLPIRDLFSSKLTDVLQDEDAPEKIFGPAREAMTAAFDQAVEDFAR